MTAPSRGYMKLYILTRIPLTTLEDDVGDIILDELIEAAMIPSSIVVDDEPIAARVLESDNNLKHVYELTIEKKNV